MDPDAHQLLDPLQRFGDADCRELRNPEGTHLHSQCFRSQPLTVTGLTGHQRQKLLKLLALSLPTGITQLPFENRKNPLKRTRVCTLSLAVTAVGLDQDWFATAIQQHIPLFIGELVPRGFDLKSKGLTHRIEQGEVVGVVLLSPGSNRRVDRLAGIGNHPFHRELAQVTDAVTSLTGAVGAVEREESRRQLLNHRSVHRTGEILGIQTLAIHTLRKLLSCLGNHFHQSQTITPFQGGAQGIGEPLLHTFPCHEAIHDHLDVVAVVLVELDVVCQLTHLPVDPHPCKPLGCQTADQLAVGALLAPDHWCQQLVSRSLRQQQDVIDHLVDALRPDRTTALGTVGFASATEQKAQIVLNLGDGADGRSRVVTCRFLIDRNSGRQTLDGIDIGLVHLTKKLPGVSGKTLDVAALTLRKDRVERQGALAAATDTGEHHQLVARDRDVDVFEIVLSGPPHPDLIVLITSGEVHSFRAIRVVGSRSPHDAPVESSKS